MNLSRIVVLDSRPADSGDISWDELSALGSLQLHARTTPDEVAERIHDAHIVLSNKVKLPAQAFEAAPNLKLVSVLATGYDIIDLKAARRAGVTVCNVPAYSTASTAQTTVALLLELTQHVGAHSEAVRAGGWAKCPDFSFWNFPLCELEGKALLIVGLGAIGERVARVCEALGMTVIAAQLPGRASPNHSEFRRLPLKDALPMADVVSLHCPATSETRGLVNEKFLSQMKPSALLLNTARGVLLDEAAVARALSENRLGGFAGDVLSTEPPSADNPLLSAPRCIVTPHIAWASIESRRRLVAQSAANVRAFLEGAPRNVVS